MLTMNLSEMRRYLRISGAFPDYSGRNTHADGKRRYRSTDNRSGPGNAALAYGDPAKYTYIGAKPDIILDGNTSVMGYLAGSDQRLSVADIIVSTAYNKATLPNNAIVTNENCISSGRLHNRLGIDADISTNGD